jgi:hypothetical protein
MIEQKDLLKILEEYEPTCISADPAQRARFASYEMAGYAFLVAAYKSLQCAEAFSHEGTDGVIHGAKRLIEDWFEGFTREDINNEET